MDSLVGCSHDAENLRAPHVGMLTCCMFEKFENIEYVWLLEIVVHHFSSQKQRFHFSIFAYSNVHSQEITRQSYVWNRSTKKQKCNHPQKKNDRNRFQNDAHEIIKMPFRVRLFEIREKQKLVIFGSKITKKAPGSLKGAG